MHKCVFGYMQNTNNQKSQTNLIINSGKFVWKIKS